MDSDDGIVTDRSGTVLGTGDLEVIVPEYEEYVSKTGKSITLQEYVFQVMDVPKIYPSLGQETVTAPAEAEAEAEAESEAESEDETPEVDVQAAPIHSTTTEGGGFISHANTHTLADLVNRESDLTLLAKMLASADASVVAMLTDEGGNYTLFAPTDAAFTDLARMGVDLSALLQSSSAAREFLTYHLLPQRITSTEFRTKKYTSVQGEDISVVSDLFGLSLRDKSFNIFPIRITESNLFANNGVLHKIDKVLLSKAAAAHLPAGTLLMPRSNATQTTGGASAANSASASASASVSVSAAPEGVAVDLVSASASALASAAVAAAAVDVPIDVFTEDAAEVKLSSVPVLGRLDGRRPKDSRVPDLDALPALVRSPSIPTSVPVLGRVDGRRRLQTPHVPDLASLPELVRVPSTTTRSRAADAVAVCLPELPELVRVSLGRPIGPSHPTVACAGDAPFVSQRSIDRAISRAHETIADGKSIVDGVLALASDPVLDAKLAAALRHAARALHREFLTQDGGNVISQSDAAVDRFATELDTMSTHILSSRASTPRSYVGGVVDPDKLAKCCGDEVHRDHFAASARAICDAVRTCGAQTVREVIAPVFAETRSGLSVQGLSSLSIVFTVGQAFLRLVKAAVKSTRRATVRDAPATPDDEFLATARQFDAVFNSVLSLKPSISAQDAARRFEVYANIAIAMITSPLNYLRIATSGVNAHPVLSEFASERVDKLLAELDRIRALSAAAAGVETTQARLGAFVLPSTDPQKVLINGLKRALNDASSKKLEPTAQLQNAQLGGDKIIAKAVDHYNKEVLKQVIEDRLDGISGLFSIAASGVIFMNAIAQSSQRRSATEDVLDRMIIPLIDRL